MWVVWYNFAPRHASRALQHVLKIKKGDIAVHKVAISDRFQKRYWALYDSGKGQMDSKKRLNKYINESKVLQQESAVGNLLQKRGVMVSDSAFSSSSISNFPSALAWTSTASLLEETGHTTICLLISEIDGIHHEHGHLEIK
jgi:hypothetical protein